MTPAQARVVELHVYPLKSAAGNAVEQLTFDRRGPAGDRRLMLVSLAGRFITQRTHPRLALIGASLAGDLLTLTAPGHAAVAQPIPRQGALVPVKIFRDTIEVLEVPGPAAQLCSAFLETECRLVAIAEGSARETSEAAGQPMGEPAGQPTGAPAGQPTGEPAGQRWPISLVDAWPLLVLSRASIAALNARLPHQVRTSRFRPNIVLELPGSAPHTEDRIARLRAPGLELIAAKPCGRCTITEVDQERGAVDEGPLTALRAYRLPAESTSPKFGMYFAALPPTAPLQLGTLLDIDWR